MSASPQARKRLQKEHAAFQKNPPPFIWARPNESNILEWHFLFKGPEQTPFHKGEYWGVVEFPKDYPFAPPGLKMNTPSGRFTPSAAICTSMSNFHPGSWNVAWSVETILIGLQSFMNSDEITTGSMRTTDQEKREYAKKSHEWNIAQPKFRTIFPEYAEKEEKSVPNMSGSSDVAKKEEVEKLSSGTRAGQGKMGRNIGQYTLLVGTGVVALLGTVIFLLRSINENQ